MANVNKLSSDEALREAIKKAFLAKMLRKA